MSTLKIPGLTQYEVPRLDPKEQLALFRGILKRARKEPGETAAEELCKASRSLAYALYEQKWWLDGGDAAFRKIESAAQRAMRDALGLRSTILDATPVGRREHISAYFDNIATRSEWVAPQKIAA